MSPNLEFKFDYYAILPHVTELRVLMLSGENGWALPQFTLSERHFWQEVHQVNRAMKDRFGIQVTTLRCVGVDYDRQAGRVTKVYAMENHDPDWVPPSRERWVDRDELDDLVFAMPEQQQILEEWFVCMADVDASPLRVPWFKQSWFNTATRWITAQLNHQGIELTGPIEQLRSWQRSSLLRAKTNAGDFYFKAVPKMFAHEPALTQALAEKYPENFPEVVAVDAQRHFMLMKSVDGQTWDDVTEIKLWENALSTYAQIQIDLTEQTENLLKLGCPDRRLDTSVDQIDPLLADTAAMLPEQPGGLSESEIAQLRALAPPLKSMFAELANYSIPQTLEHGDLWPGQIVFRREKPVFIDWSDSSISHPFFSLNFLSDPIEMQPFLTRAPNVRERLSDAYLEPWTSFAPMEKLKRIFKLADLLAPLHYATLYHMHILPNMEIQWEMEKMIPFYLKKLLRSFSSNDI